MKESVHYICKKKCFPGIFNILNTFIRLVWLNKALYTHVKFQISWYDNNLLFWHFCTLPLRLDLSVGEAAEENNSVYL